MSIYRDIGLRNGATSLVADVPGNIGLNKKLFLERTKIPENASQGVNT